MLTQIISMGPKTNIDLIRALEKRIEEGGEDIIKLKRDRNSLLNISTRVPPEVLGSIFAWTLVREHYWCFERLGKGSHNFLLVCHHWFKVASRTPELWSFWGNTLQDWKKRHHRSGAAPIDLALFGSSSNPVALFDESLQDAIRKHVMQDTIRQVHLDLVSKDSDTMSAIISSLTPNDGGGQNENIESIIWFLDEPASVDVSDFFARSRLSRLRQLSIYGDFRISSWDRLASRTTLLAILSLKTIASQPSPTITASQLFSILTSNPNLQELGLSDTALPNDVDGSTFQVPLHNLKSLCLTGEFRYVFGLLAHLILPEALDEMDLDVSDSTAEDVSQTLAPYIRDRFRHDTRFQDRLSMSFFSTSSVASISVSTERTQTTTLAYNNRPRVSLIVHEVGLPPPGVAGQLLLNLIMLAPLEHVRDFCADDGTDLIGELFLAMPNIETLSISNPDLSQGFLQPNPDGPHPNTKLLPSLRSLRLEDIRYMDDDDWGELMTYLVHQTSDNQPISLRVVGGDGCPEVIMSGIKALVKEFTYEPELEGESTWMSSEY